MPKIRSHYYLLRYLDTEYQRLSSLHYKSAPRGGAVPVGGGDWMDTFFRMEAIRGCMSALRLGKPLQEAVDDGKKTSEIAVKKWNDRREYQVHRWHETAHEYLDTLIRLYRGTKNHA